MHAVDRDRLRTRYNTPILGRLSDAEARRRPALAFAIPCGKSRQADDVVGNDTLGWLERIPAALEVGEVEMTNDPVKVGGTLRARDRLRIFLDLKLDPLGYIHET